MKNTSTDYFTQLRSDFIPKEKNQPGHSRRPFNPGDPNELRFISAVSEQAGYKTNTLSFSSDIVQPGNQMPS